MVPLIKVPQPTYRTRTATPCQPQCYRTLFSCPTNQNKAWAVGLLDGSSQGAA